MPAMLIKHDCIIRAVTRYAVAALLASAAVLAVAQPNDGDFAAARDAYRAGDAARLAGIAPRLAGHLLESYVEYWQLKLGLDDAETERVRAFLDRYAGTPLSDRLRADWLKVLGKRGDWTTFESEFPKHVGEDAEVACYAIQAQRQRIGDSVLEDARRYWFTGQDQPDACQSLFVAMQATGRLTSQDLWARFRLAHEAGNYRLVGRIASSLPLAERPAQRELDRIDRGALAVLLKGGYRVTSPAARELALYALDRVARSDAAAAHEAWLKCRRRFPQAEQSYGNLIVAYNASRQLLPGANQWYRETGGAALNDYQHAWRVRAALRAGAWEGVAQAIDAMPEAQSQEPALSGNITSTVFLPPRRSEPASSL